MTNKVQKLQRACLVAPVKVEVAHKYSTVDTLRQQYMFVPAKYKDCYLAFVLNELSGSTAMVRAQAAGCDRGRGAAGAWSREEGRGLLPGLNGPSCIAPRRPAHPRNMPARPPAPT
jgi:hypothetical protein